MKFKSDIEVQAGLRDGSDDIGTAGQILSSTGSQTNWIDQGTIISAASKLVVIACKNTSGATITKGTPVYQTGTVGATDVIEIAEADASDEDKMAAIGLLQTDINNNDFGNVVITGELLNFTTDPIDGVTPTTGDTIYVKSGGGLTLTKPTGLEFIQNVGLVGKVSGGNSGSITVSSIMRSNDVPTPLYVDHDNQRLGIGTDSPSAKLEVMSSSQTLSTAKFESIELQTYTVNNSWVGENLYYDGSFKYRANGYATALYFDGSGFDIRTAPSGTAGTVATLTTAFTLLESSGNVGIGTTSPAAGLQVALGGTTIPAAGASTASAVFGNSTSDDNYGVAIGANSSGVGYISSQRTDGTTTTYNLAIQPNGGNVGIGTASPDSLLHIKGADPVFIIQDTSTGTVNASSTLRLGESGAGGVLDVYWDIKQAADNLNTHLEINHSANGNHLTILDGGNVGIGETNPTYKLHVGGAVYSSSTIGNLTAGSLGQQMELGNASVTTFRFDANRWRLYAGASVGEVFTVEETGNVGINNTGPDYKLEVNGTFGVSDLPFNTDSVSVLVADEITGVEEVTNGSFTTDADWNKNSNWTISGGTANADGTSNNDMNQIPVNGYPVVGEVFRVSFEITARTQGQVRIAIGGGATDYLSAVGKYEYIHTALNTDRIRIQSNGSFIGSVDNLSIKQITSASNQIQKRELGTGAFGPTPVGAYLPLSAGSSYPLTGHLFIDTPAGASQSGYALKLKKTNSSSVVQVGAEIFATPWASNTNGGTIIFKNADTATNLQETLRISANGSVGINSTSSSYKLDVGGNARFQDSVYIDTSTGSGGLYVTRLGNTNESLKIYTSDSTSVFETFQDENTGEYGSMAFILDNGAPDPSYVFRYGSIVRLKIEGGTGDVILKDALLSNQKNTNVDTGAEVVALVAHATYTAAFFDFVVKKGTNVRSGTVYACHNGDTTPLVEFTETSTNDLGDTSDVTLSVDISGANMRLLATVASDDWSVKSLIRAI